MASDHATGSLLRTLAASRPGGRFLELGTGTGLASAWLLAGMDAGSRLVTVETEAPVLAVARHHLGSDGRVTFVEGDAADYLRAAGRASTSSSRTPGRGSTPTSIARWDW